MRDKEKVLVHIAVMDYCSNSIKMYNAIFNFGWQASDVEEWLSENTDYSNYLSYFMCSEKEIKIEYA